MKMRNAFIFCTLCVLASPLVAAGAEAKGTKSIAPRLTADQIIAKNVTARGGLMRWRAIHSMSMSGRMDAGRVMPADTEKAYLERRMARGGERRALLEKETGNEKADADVQLPFVIAMERPRKMRLEITFQGQTAVQVFDGVNGWKVRPFLGRVDAESYTPDEMKSASQQQDLDGLLIDCAAKGTKVHLNGMERVEGRDTYKLKLTLKDGSVRYVWVDAKTFLDVKIDGSRRLDGKLHQVATFLRNYQTVGGIKIPFLLETSVEGVKDSERIIIDQVVLNPKLDKTLFVKPHMG